ncbi:sigma-70 family RNA polymerase sigma factor [Lentisphaera profundi]|uniref:RNA polymerase sigma factor SigS n=1 Tax=Lentisphaera profundi TaxID=1658616 RepID=A0ABY7VV16_9BACT|nr:sigma-70 family RNA polymerase sigma factor [Lentisphaera profundi]WDE97594.1 sigma-70 family RNA polymerase sigma factor [Lentisphaera profundi]
MSKWNTRYTLIQRAQNSPDNDTWEEFIQAYSKFIYYMLHQMQVPKSLVDDLAQEIILNLWSKLSMYAKEKGKFRSWLTRVIRNSATDSLKKEQRYNKRQENASEVLELLESMSESDFEQIIDREWRAHMIKLTLDSLSDQLSETAIEVFKLSMEQVSTDDIAEKMDITPASVYTLKNRVKEKFTRRLKHFVAELEF